MRARVAAARGALTALAGGAGGEAAAAAAAAADGDANSTSGSSAHLPEAAASLAAAAQLARAADALARSALAAWQDATAAWLRAVAGWKAAKLVTFDSVTRRARAAFGESLVVFLREVRQLRGLGAPLPRALLAEADVAQKFYSYGMVLRQCAAFYNSIGSQMIEPAKPLLLADARALEAALASPRDAQGREITWRSAAALEGYVRRLSEVADRLAGRNRRVRAVHSHLAAIVARLADTDLARRRDRWAAGVKEMRAAFARLEAEGCARDAQTVWRQHFDFQLLKALEVQYRRGLQTLARALPEVDARVVLRAGAPALEPPLEELRAALHRGGLAPFLALPAKMKGVSDLSERPGFFKRVCLCDPAGVAKAHADAEAALARAAAEARRLREWAALAALEARGSSGSGAADGSSSGSGGGGGEGGLEALVEAECATVEDFESNLRGLKAALRDLDRVPAVIAVDCFRLATAPFKRGVEASARRLRVALVSVLRRRAGEERRALEDLVASGEALLARPLARAEDVGAAGTEACALAPRLAGAARALQRLEEKNRLLRAMAAGGGSGSGSIGDGTEYYQTVPDSAVDAAAVTARLDTLAAGLQRFDGHLEAERARLRAELARRLEALGGDVAALAARWEALRPRDGPGGGAGAAEVVLAQLDGAEAQLADLRAAADRLAAVSVSLLRVVDPLARNPASCSHRRRLPVPPTLIDTTTRRPTRSTRRRPRCPSSPPSRRLSPPRAPAGRATLNSSRRAPRSPAARGPRRASARMRSRIS